METLTTSNREYLIPTFRNLKITEDNGRVESFSWILYGTFSGGTVTIHASNDGTNYAPIQGASFTTAISDNLHSSMLNLKFVLTGGDGSTAIVVDSVPMHST